MFFYSWRQRRNHRQWDDVIRTTTWDLLGLPPTTACRRFLGGWGRSGDATTPLELAHLPPDGSLEKQLRVEIKEMDEPLEALTAGLARGVWTRAHHPSHHPGDFDSLRRHMEKVRRDYETESEIRWEPVTLMVDREPVACQQARYGDYWVAMFERDGLLVTIIGQDWPDHAPELVTITDVEPYIEGSQRLWREGFNRR